MKEKRRMEKPIATRDEIRAFDRYAIETLGVPGIILMENAGRQIADVARAMLAPGKRARVVILAGPGNNGGDGFVVARHLAMAGIRAEVALLAPREKIVGDADTNLRVLEALGFQVRVLAGDVEAMLGELRPMLAEADLVVDGMLGTGTRGEIREPYASAIGAVNDARRPVLAIDIPSGLDPDTGEPLGPTVRATKTVTLAAVKVGFRKPGAEEYTGEVVLADIGVRFERFQGTGGKKG
jgi:NAD(P)H-hydrate epimerase